MRLFYIVSKSPACVAVHDIALKKIKESLAAGHKVQGIFFINEGAQCASLLVCGRAFKTCGFNASVLKDGYILSGNTELIIKLNDCDEVKEF